MKIILSNCFFLIRVIMPKIIKIVLEKTAKKVKPPVW